MNINQIRLFSIKAVTYCQECRSRGRWIPSTDIYPDDLKGDINLLLYEFKILCKDCYKKQGKK